jgi:hypothetical protein
MGYHCKKIYTKFYQTSLSEGQVHIQIKLLGITIEGFNVTDQLLIRFSTFVRYWRKYGSTMRQLTEGIVAVFTKLVTCESRSPWLQ